MSVEAISDGELTDRLLGPLWERRGRWLWRGGVAVCAAATLMLIALCSYTVAMGIGVWGNNVPVAWAFGIVNFVWWVGIGHAGTFISAILLLLEQRWRTSVARFAEAMTLFAVIQAGLFPLIHLGRPWFAYWMVPYPSTMKVWPNFKSALPWDSAALAAYFLVSLLFWYVGLLPDLAAARDRAPERWRRRVYGVFALGWRGSGRAHHHYRMLYGLLAGLITPLVISVHSIVSADFAITLVPGWHSTIFPPYFVAGAIFSGFAMVVLLAAPVRWAFRLHDIITERHFDALGKMLLVTSWFVAYAYVIEPFFAYYGGETADRHTAIAARVHSVWFWLQVGCNAALPQLLWSRAVRTRPVVLWTIALFINFGMWLERYVTIVGALTQEYVPSKWHAFAPTLVDVGILVGTFGFFGLLFLLFLRWVPFMSLSELKELGDEKRKEALQPVVGVATWGPR